MLSPLSITCPISNPTPSFSMTSAFILGFRRIWKRSLLRPKKSYLCQQLGSEPACRILALEEVNASVMNGGIEHEKCIGHVQCY